MRALFTALLLALALFGGAQKISEMPTFPSDGSEAWVPVAIGGANYKIKGRLLAAQKLDSIRVRDSSAYWYADGVEHFAGRVTTSVDLTGFLKKDSAAASYLPLTGGLLSGNLRANARIGIGLDPAYPLHVSPAAPASVTSGNGTAATSFTLFLAGQTGGSVNATAGNPIGGLGGKVYVHAGVGGTVSGTPTTGTGGPGGYAEFYAGDGGSGTTQGGDGGDATVAAGSGGLSGAGNAGNGGNVEIKGGNSGTAGNATGGSVYVIGGNKSGTGKYGDIYLGALFGGQVRGNVRIGAPNAPTARLHPAAGTATLPPLKLDPGTNTTTPQDGAFEYDGANLTFAIGSDRRSLTAGLDSNAAKAAAAKQISDSLNASAVTIKNAGGTGDSLLTSPAPNEIQFKRLEFSGAGVGVTRDAGSIKVTIPGGGGGFNGDSVLTDLRYATSGKGPVIKDTTNGKFYRLRVIGGALAIQEVTLTTTPPGGGGGTPGDNYGTATNAVIYSGAGLYPSGTQWTGIGGSDVANSKSFALGQSGLYLATYHTGYHLTSIGLATSATAVGYGKGQYFVIFDKTSGKIYTGNETYSPYDNVGSPVLADGDTYGLEVQTDGTVSSVVFHNGTKTTVKTFPVTITSTVYFQAAIGSGGSGSIDTPKTNR